MHTAIRDTSLQARDALIESGALGRQAQQIVDWIGRRNKVSMRLGVWVDFSLQEICKGTGMPINAVSGRVNDCKRAGALVEGDRRRCSVTGRNVIPVMLPRPPEDPQSSLSF